MRLYTLTNYYLSSIQIGIQSAHVLGELVNKYPEIPCDLTVRVQSRETLCDWMQNYKTMICLNGGNNADLMATFELFNDLRNTGLPFAKFNEDEQSMDGMLTCIGIVVPEYIYNAEDRVIASDSTSTTYGYFYNDIHLSTWEEEVFLKLKSCSLAR
jgi:hypothetical protein